jgi:hypothetical protein
MVNTTKVFSILAPITWMLSFIVAGVDLNWVAALAFIFSFIVIVDLD